jgi:hypothetical protein
MKHILWTGALIVALAGAAAPALAHHSLQSEVRHQPVDHAEGNRHES